MSEEAAEDALQAFAQGPWGKKYPTVVLPGAGLGACDAVLRVPACGRKVIYTTNAIESLNMQLRKIIKTRGHFPNDEAAIKLLWLALRNIRLNGAVRRMTGKRHEPVCHPLRGALHQESFVKWN